MGHGSEGPREKGPPVLLRISPFYGPSVGPCPSLLPLPGLVANPGKGRERAHKVGRGENFPTGTTYYVFTVFPFC